MKTKIYLILVGVLFGFAAFSQTNIPGGDVSGTWTKANSPFIIDGYITIQNSDLLTIEPGVEVIFSAADFGLTVEGRILAEGTYHDSIKFTSSSLHWRRLKFLNTNTNGQDSSKLVYCNVEKGYTYNDIYTKEGGGIYCENSSKLCINRCLINDNVATPGSGGGIGLVNSDPIITNSIIRNNLAISAGGSYGGGIWCSASNPTLINLLIINNEVSGEDTFGGGLALISSNPVIENITVYGNVLDGATETRGGGLFYHSLSGSTSVINSIIRSNTSDEIYIEDGTVTVSYSNIGGGYTGTGNINADPLFYDFSEDDFRLTWDNYPTEDATKSPCIDTGDPASPIDPDGTQADMGAYYWHHGTRVCGLESGTWTLVGSPYIVECDIIISSSNELIIEAGVEILFDNPHQFNVDGRLYADGTVTNPITFSIFNPNIKWRGIRFTNTSTNGQNNSLLNYCNISNGEAVGGVEDFNYGGGIFCENSSDVWIFNCEIFDNYAVEKGGGIYCLNSDILLSNCLIKDNGSGNEGGGICCENSDIIASNIYVEDNSAQNGGGIFLLSCNPLIEQSSITGNEAPSGGGLLLDNSSGSLKYVTVANNIASWGGGLACITSGNPALNNLTISENTASSLGGGIYSLNSNPALTNSIVWNNYSPQEIYLGSGGNVSATYSDIKQPGDVIWPGTGNINTDPQFIDPLGWDFHFSWIDYPDPETKSPCIDTGDPLSTNDPDGTRTDMGAIPYEQVYTSVSGGDINGILTCAGSPYNIFGDITIQTGEELIIEPCVYVIFQGDYKLTVNGRLLAQGTEADKITFYPADRNTGWQGIRFQNLNSNGQDSAKLIHCRILDGNADGGWIWDYGGAIYASQSSNLLIDECYFCSNQAKTKGGAVYLTQSSPDIRNCIFENNYALNGGAVSCYDNVGTNFLNCFFSNNVAENGGAIMTYSCTPIFSGCSMTNNRALKFGGAIYHSASGPLLFDEINRCNIYDNYADYAGLDFYTDDGYYTPPVLEVFLDTASVALMNEHFAYPFSLFNFTATHSRFIQENSDLYVSSTGSDLNSGTSAADPLKTIKLALIKVIADIDDPKTIHLADGTYSPSLTSETLPINHRSHITLSGEFHNTTNIDGDSLHRIMISYADVNHSVQNLKFQNGFSDGDGGAVVIENYSNPLFYLCGMVNNYCTGNGGAINCDDHCSPVFNLSYIMNNYAYNSGGGLFMQGNDTIIMDNMIIALNTSRYAGGGIWAEYNDYFHINNSNISENNLLNGGGGGAFFRQGDVQIDNTVFVQNHVIGNGGGLHASYNVNLDVNKCTFTYNSASRWGGGMYFYLGVDANLENVKFLGNSSVHGGGLYGTNGSALNIRNGLFDGNNTLYDTLIYGKGDGGAMSLHFVETNLYNVTVANNASSMIGGGLYFYSDASTVHTVQNSIVYDNTPNAISTEYDASVAVSYSDIEGGWSTGTGNINADPDFTSEYWLTSGSPCINAGNLDTTGMNIPLFDLAENPRISNDTIDMGAYEFFQGIELDLKAFLEGPYNGTTMNTDLNGHPEPCLPAGKAVEGLPIHQPYNSPPWNYTGIEEVISTHPTNTVDWILLQVRDTTDVSVATAESINGQQAVFLLNDGSIVDINGLNPKFGRSINHQCYIAILHRNHLGIISAVPLSESGGIYSYDFTIGASQAYGTDAQKNLGSGIYGLYGGDGNADRTINIDDKTTIWSIEGGNNGYLNSDFNMDSQTDNIDKNDIWIENNGNSSQIPE